MTHDTLQICLVAHTAATVYMAGVIWAMQLVHYPLYPLIGENERPAFSRAHVRRAMWMVGPAMLVELVCAFALAFGPTNPPFAPGLAWAGLALLAVIYGSTALFQMPHHTRLTRGPDPEAARRLAPFNWIRTIAWTARAGLALAMLS